MDTRPPLAGGHSAAFEFPQTTHSNNPWAVRDAVANAPDSVPAVASPDDRPLGTAIAQLHGIYILAQDADGLVLVDMHAGHERVLYEKMKADHATRRADAQQLLEPVVVALPEPIADRMVEDADEWARCGFDIQQLAPDRIAVRSVPALLAREDVAALVRTTALAITNDEGAHHVEGAEHRLLATLGLPRRRARRPPSQPAGDGCAAAADGADRPRQPVQPRAPHVHARCTRGSGSAVPARQVGVKLPRAIAILGPTGCGKSALAMRIAAELPVEIISVDSAQVYRGMDIGTAKPASPNAARYRIT